MLSLYFPEVLLNLAKFFPSLEDVRLSNRVEKLGDNEDETIQRAHESARNIVATLLLGGVSVAHRMAGVVGEPVVGAGQILLLASTFATCYRKELDGLSREVRVSY